MRGKDPQGRFDTLFEMESIYEGIAEDLQTPVGQTVDWWEFDSVATVGDPVYDVGDFTVTGRMWKASRPVPVVQATIVQGPFAENDRGFYVTDNLKMVIAVDVIETIFPGFVEQSDPHFKDRIVYRNEVFTPTLIYPKGHIHQHLTVVTVIADQVKPDELVNDTQFAAYL